MGRHGALQFIEQERIDGVDGIDERRHGGARHGTQQPAHRILRARAFDLALSHR